LNCGEKEKVSEKEGDAQNYSFGGGEGEVWVVQLGHTYQVAKFSDLMSDTDVSVLEALNYTNERELTSCV